MNLLKQEKAALAALLEEGADTPEHLAELVVKKLDELRAQRTFHYGIYVIAGTAGIIGPYATAKQAEKALALTGADRAWVNSGRTPEGWVRHVASVDEEPAPYKLSADEERKRAKAFWPRAHALMEGEAVGIIAHKGGVQVVNIQSVQHLREGSSE